MRAERREKSVVYEVLISSYRLMPDWISEAEPTKPVFPHELD